MTPEFYAAARELTEAHGSLLLIDSIQAGLRAHGVLSIVDYPGFEELDAPDMETYSKALNAGQYPMSVLAVTDRAAATLPQGHLRQHHDRKPACARRRLRCPRCADHRAARKHPRPAATDCVAKLESLREELPGYITQVQGTGLLFSCELSDAFKCYGAGSTEEWMREHGFGVIHGGANSLRFTPHFAISDAEADLLVEGVRRALVEGPRKTQAPHAAAA